MAKIYQGKVSLFSNLKKEVVVKPDVDGKFDSESIAELYKTMLTVAKSNKLTPKVFKPEATGDTPVLMSDRWGKPYIALLPERKAPGAIKITVVKLA